MKILGVSLLVVLLGVVAGCSRRADYLELQTESGLLKNAWRVTTVLCPLGMGAQILTAEMMRNAGESCGCSKCDTCE